MKGVTNEFIYFPKFKTRIAVKDMNGFIFTFDMNFNSSLFHFFFILLFLYLASYVEYFFFLCIVVTVHAISEAWDISFLIGILMAILVLNNFFFNSEKCDHKKYFVRILIPSSFIL